MARLAGGVFAPPDEWRRAVRATVCRANRVPTVTRGVPKPFSGCLVVGVPDTADSVTVSEESKENIPCVSTGSGC